MFREGMFWKAYQQAAYLFVSNLRQYQVNRNYVKKVGEDVLSLGFPVPSSAKIRIRLLNDLRQIPLKHYAALAEQFSVLLSEIDKWKAAM